MRYIIKAVKPIDAPKEKDSNKKRGDVRGGSYIKRIVTGQDKDGSPQYRYIRSQAELDAYEASQKKNKPKKDKDKNKLKEKVNKEHKDSKAAVTKKEKDKETTKKSFFVKKV